MADASFAADIAYNSVFDRFFFFELRLQRENLRFFVNERHNRRGRSVYIKIPGYV